ncbi:hypothetical protein [Salinimonas iocasae]|uniref:Uncharacterized protein n=1 Tax=Salinimonas iocasae TaxID=2572577 RepID=A0A5B7YDQ1_9ALTE|nr:hypothetical protein [Salinimonas iocasae]QCZ93346.1 hypothetical protein FBQ74_07530 [Salinimonas iocasae]
MNTKIKLLALAALFTASFTSHASEKAVHGTYVPVKGTVETFEVSDPTLGEAPEQLGRYKIYLVNSAWRSMSAEERKSTRYLIKVEGLVAGKIDLATLLVSHKLLDDDHRYTLRSENDFFIPQSGDLYCSTGTPLVIQEQINLVKGTGQYSNLSEGTIMLNGVINNCPGESDFGKNVLEIIPFQGSVTFE